MFDFLKSSLEVIPLSYHDGLLAFRCSKKLSPGKTVKLKLLFVSDGEPQSPVMSAVLTEVEPHPETGFVCKGALKAKDSEVVALVQLLMRAGIPGACRRASRRLHHMARILSRQLPNFRAVSTDISLNGALIVTEGAVEPGQYLNLEFDLETVGEGKLTVQVVSVWQRQEPNEKSVQYSVGVALTEQSRHTREAWQRLYSFLTGNEEGNVMQRTISGSVVSQSANVSKEAARRAAPPPPPPAASPPPATPEQPAAPPAYGFSPPPVPGPAIPGFTPPGQSTPTFQAPPQVGLGQKSEIAQLEGTPIPDSPFAYGFGSQSVQGPAAQRRLQLSKDEMGQAAHKPHPPTPSEQPRTGGLRLPDANHSNSRLSLPGTASPTGGLNLTGSSGFGQPSSPGFSTPPAPSFGQQSNQGFTPPPAPSFGQQPSLGFTPPPAPSFGQQSSQGFTPPPAPSFGQQSNQGFSPPPAPSFGQQPSQGFTPPPAPSFGQQSNQGFTPPPAPSFGQQSNQGFTPPPAPSFGQQPSQGFTPPPAPSFGQQPSQGFTPPPPPNFGQPPGQGFTPPPPPPDFKL